MKNKTAASQNVASQIKLQNSSINDFAKKARDKAIEAVIAKLKMKNESL